MDTLISTAGGGEAGFQGTAARLQAEQEQARQVQRSVFAQPNDPAAAGDAIAAPRPIIPAPRTAPNEAALPPVPVANQRTRDQDFVQSVIGDFATFQTLPPAERQLRLDTLAALRQHDKDFAEDKALRDQEQADRELRNQSLQLDFDIRQFDFDQAQKAALEGPPELTAFEQELQDLDEFSILREARLGAGQTATGGEPLTPLTLQDSLGESGILDTLQSVPEFARRDLQSQITGGFGEIPEGAAQSVFRDAVTAAAGILDEGGSLADVQAMVDLVVSDHAAAGDPLPEGFMEVILAAVQDGPSAGFGFSSRGNLRP